jgi:hypothetical protein
MKSSLIILSLLMLATSCEISVGEGEPDPAAEAGSKVEFYYIVEQEIDSYQVQINESKVELADTVLIPYEEILSYNAKTYTFTVTDEARKRLEYYRGFAVTVDREIIYTGYFWTSLSSRSVDWVVIDLIRFKGNELTVQLGYPPQLSAVKITDKRNDPRILEVFRRDGKLIE